MNSVGSGVGSFFEFSLQQVVIPILTESGLQSYHPSLLFFKVEPCTSTKAMCLEIFTLALTMPNYALVAAFILLG